MRLRFRSLGLALLSVAAAGVLLQIGPAQASSEKARGSTASATKQQALAAYGKLPLAFTANAGQTDKRVRYSAQGAGFSVFLTRREAMLSSSVRASGGGRRSRSASSARTRTSPSAASAGAGQGQLPARERPRQVAHRPADLRARRLPRPLAGCGHGLRGQNGTLKYEFLVRPGARVSDIRLAYRGAKRLSLDRRGNLRIGTCARRPHRHAAAELPARRRQAGARPSSFALGRAAAPMASPSAGAMTAGTRSSSTRGLLYSTYLGGGGDERGSGIAVDGAGSAYLTGMHVLGGLPDHPGAFDTTLQRGHRRLRDEAERERRRSRLLDLPWWKRRRRRLRIALDAAGSAYVTGLHDSADFPTTAGRLRHDLQRRRRCLRDEAGRERRRPRLLHLPGRKRRRPRLRHRGRRRRQRLRDRGTPARRTSRRPRVPSTRRSTAARRLRDEARRERRRPRLLHLPGRNALAATRLRRSRSTAPAAPT